MKRILCIVAILVGVSAPAYAQSSGDNLPAHYSTEDKLYAFSTVWSELKYNFVHIDRIPFNPDSLYRACLPAVLASKNDVEFFDLLKRFVAAFNDGHTSVLSYSYNWNDVFDFAPLMVEELDGRYYISQVWESAHLDSTALGSEIIEIDGMPTQQYVSTYCFPTIAVGSEAEKYRAAANEIGTGFPGSLFNAVLRYRDGRKVEVHIENNFNRLRRTGQLGRSWAWKGIRTGNRDALRLDWPEKGVARLSFREFDEKSLPLLDSLLSVIAVRADALIIDLRECSGGSSRVGDSLAARILNRDYLLTGGSRVRINNGYGRAQGNYRSEYEAFYRFRAYAIEPSDTIRIDRSKVLKCPIALLIGGRTASATETFLVRIHELPERPVLLGQQTSGSTGAPLVIELPHGACVRICTRCQLFPLSGKPFVNEGIEPDIRITPSIEDYMLGNDRVLKRALHLLDTSDKECLPPHGCQSVSSTP